MSWLDDAAKPLTGEDLRRAVEMVFKETIQPNAWIMSPDQWRWHKERMDILGVKTIEELYAHIADEDRFIAWLTSLGWRPAPTG